MHFWNSRLSIVFTKYFCFCKGCNYCKYIFVYFKQAFIFVLQTQLRRFSDKVSYLQAQSAYYRNGIMNKEVTTLTPALLPRNKVQPIVSEVDKALRSYSSSHVQIHENDLFEK